MRYWLMKTEPDTFSITDLERVKVEPWSGVRSFFARAHMRNMSVGDAVLFYHSSCNPPGVAGLAKVLRTNVVDETQFDPASKYFEEKATREKPVWDCVDVEYVSTLPHYVTIERIRNDPDLAQMVLLKPGRLSVQPVSAEEYARIVEMSATPSPVFPKKKPTPTPRKQAAKSKTTPAKANKTATKRRTARPKR